MVTGALGFPGEQSTHTDRSLPGKVSEGTSQGRTHLTVTAALPPTRAGHSATTHFHETVPRSSEGRTPGHLLAPGCPSTRLDEVRRRSSAGGGDRSQGGLEGANAVPRCSRFLFPIVTRYPCH